MNNIYEMEKLIELLNESAVLDTIFENEYQVKFRATKIISKELGFIKRLVDNDKIDRLTFCTVETPSSKYEDFDLWPETPREDYTNILLMDLAIQEKPIEFLISILK